MKINFHVVPSNFGKKNKNISHTIRFSEAEGGRNAMDFLVLKIKNPINLKIHDAHTPYSRLVA